MVLHKTEIEGVFIIEPRVFADERGYFFESFSQREFDETFRAAVPAQEPPRFVQDNESRSVYGVIRGLHFQAPPFAQAKLIRCVSGKVLDVAVDLRKGSPTFMRHVAVEISADNHLQLFIPKGFAHGFSTLSEDAVIQYKCDEHYHPEVDSGFNPLSINIEWGIPADKAILSSKDSGRGHLDSSPF